MDRVDSPTAERVDPTDADLVRAMARGDSAALGLLYDRHAPLMLALCERIAGRGAEAEDLVHEVFLEAWRRANDYDPARASVRSWLLLRARSRALDLKKSARVARRAGGDERSLLDELADPSQEPSLSADRAKVQRALLALPPEQQRVLLLGYFEGLSSSEMAERLAIPIGTVKSRTAAALAALRAALAAPEGTP